MESIRWQIPEGRIRHVGIQGSCPQVKEAQKQIQRDLWRRQGNADGIQYNQTGEHPVNRAVKSTGQERQFRRKQTVQQPQRKHQPLKNARRKPAPEQQYDAGHGVAYDVNQKESLQSLLHHPAGGQFLGQPAGIKQVVEHNGDNPHLDRQDDVELHGHDTFGLLRRFRRGSRQQLGQAFERLPIQVFHGQDSTRMGGDSSQQLQGPRRHLFHRPHPANAFVTAGKHPLVRTDEFHAARFQRFHILLRGRVQPHFAVHRRRN